MEHHKEKMYFREEKEKSELGFGVSKRTEVQNNNVTTLSHESFLAGNLPEDSYDTFFMFVLKKQSLYCRY